jgi:NADPH-ferrihemoprotein reductase
MGRSPKKEKGYKRNFLQPWKQPPKEPTISNVSASLAYLRGLTCDPVANSVTFLVVVVSSCLVVNWKRGRKSKVSHSVLSSTPIPGGRSNQTLSPPLSRGATIPMTRTNYSVITMTAIEGTPRPTPSPTPLGASALPISGGLEHDQGSSTELEYGTTGDGEDFPQSRMTNPTFEGGPIGSDNPNRMVRDERSLSCEDSSHQYSHASTSANSYQARKIRRSNSLGSFAGSCCTCDSSTVGGGSAGGSAGGSHLSDKPAYLTIFYATQSGTSAYYAAQLQREGVEMGFDIALMSVRSLADHLKNEPFPEQELRRLLVPRTTKRGKQRGRAAFLVSTYHEGGPTDDAKRFVELMQSLEQKDPLRGLRYTVFGFGDSRYGQTFNMQAKLYDTLLEQLGARRLTPPGFGDQAKDLAYDFETFKWRSFWPKLADLSARDCARPGSRSGDETGEPTGEEHKEKKKHTFVMRRSSSLIIDPEGGFVLEIVEDSAEPRQCQDILGKIHPSSRHFVKGVDCPVKQVKSLSLQQPSPVMLVELDITPSGENGCIQPFRYETGDNICVLPVNRLSVVEEVAKHLDYGSDVRFVLVPKEENSAKDFEPPFPSPCTVREYLSFYCELTTPPRRSVLRALSQFATLAKDRDEMYRISSVTSYIEFDSRIVKENVGLAEIMNVYFPSIRIPLMNFIRLCSPLQPRWYSISSSSLVNPNSLTIAFSVISIPRTIDDSVCHGVCSHFLGNLSTADQDTCRIIKMGSSGFVVPKDPQTPLVLICNGTGIAPFRALIQEINYKKMVLMEDTGPVLLFFGIRRRDWDFIFEDELNCFIENGSLTELHLACSRQRKDKAYVQHVFAQHSERVWTLLQSGAHLYVCGANTMTSDVDAALRTAAARDVGPIDVNGYLDEMEKCQRYIREGWTSKAELYV